MTRGEAIEIDLQIARLANEERRVQKEYADAGRRLRAIIESLADLRAKRACAEIE